MLIGLDGADWKLIDAMLARGELPNLARLRREGVWGHLKSAVPLLSPLLWTTIATGKTPDQHGILSFRAEDSETGDAVPVTSNLRKVKALWNIVGSPDAGVGRVGFVGWLASWPAEEVNGFVVSDRLGYHAFAYQGEPELASSRNTYPAELFRQVLPGHRKPGDVSYAEISRFIQIPRSEFESAIGDTYQRDEPVQNLRLLLATAATYRDVGTRLYRDHQPDLFGIYFELIDSAGHLFMHYAPPQREDVSDAELERYGGAVAEVYRYQDEILGELVELADEKTAVIVVSDHGFKSGERRPRRSPQMTGPAAATWHELYGVFLAWGYGIAPPSVITGATIADIAPTVLALLGSPVAEDMAGRVLVEALTPEFLAKVPLTQIASYERGDKRVAQPAPIRSPVDQAMLERLKALGYVGGDEEASTGSAAVPGPDPEDRTSSLQLLATIHAKNKNFEEALRLLRQAAELDPSNVPTHTNLATVLMEMGRTAEAKAEFQRAIELNPELPEIHNNLGQLLRAEGDLDGAVAAFKRALEIEPNHTQTHVNLCDVYRLMGKLDLAEQECARAVTLEPDSARARNNYGAVLILEQRLDDALAQFEAVAQLDPTYAFAHHNIGYIELLRGHPERAASALRRALELAPDYQPSRSLLARALRAQGRNAEAQRILGAAAVPPPRSDPDHN